MHFPCCRQPSIAQVFGIDFSSSQPGTTTASWILLNYGKVFGHILVNGGTNHTCSCVLGLLFDFKNLFGQTRALQHHSSGVYHFGHANIALKHAGNLCISQGQYHGNLFVGKCTQHSPHFHGTFLITGNQEQLIFCNCGNFFHVMWAVGSINISAPVTWPEGAPCIQGNFNFLVKFCDMIHVPLLSGYGLPFIWYLVTLPFSMAFTLAFPFTCVDRHVSPCNIGIASTLCCRRWSAESLYQRL